MKIFKIIITNIVFFALCFIKLDNVKAENQENGIREVEISSELRIDNLTNKRYQDITISTFLGAHDSIILNLTNGYPERLPGDPDLAKKYWSSEYFYHVFTADKKDPITSKSLNNATLIGKYTHFKQRVTITMTHDITSDNEWSFEELKWHIRIIDAKSPDDVAYADELCVYYTDNVDILPLRRDVTVEYVDYQTYFSNEINETLIQQIKDGIVVKDTLTGTDLKEEVFIHGIFQIPSDDPINEMYAFGLDSLKSTDLGENNYVIYFENPLDVVKMKHIYYLTIQILPEGLYLNGPSELSLEYGEDLNDHLSKYNSSSFTDGDISESVVFDTSLVDFRLLNESQTLIVKVTDSTGLTKRKDVLITITDSEAPTFNLTSISKTVHSKTELQAFINSITVNDNYDENLSFTYNYADVERWNTPNIYTLKLYTKDSSNNDNYLEITIRWLDNEAPSIGGPNTFIIDIKDYINSDYLLGFYTAYDNKDGDVTNKIRIVNDTYKNNGSKKGTYSIRLRVVDSNGNYATKTVNIRVVDGLRDYFIADKTIYSSKNHKLDNYDLSKALHYMFNRKEGTVIFDIFLQDYDTNYNIVGSKYSGLVTGRDQNNSDIPSEIINVEVVESNLFGEKAPSSIDGNFKTILIIGVSIVVILIAFNLFGKKRRWR